LNTDFIEQFIKLQHDYHVYSNDYHGEVPVLNFSLQKHVEHVYNEQTGQVEDKEIIELAHAYAAVKNDTLELHELRKFVAQNRIEFYKNNPEIAQKEGISQDVLHEASKMVDPNQSVQTQMVPDVNQLGSTNNSTQSSTQNTTTSSASKSETEKASNVNPNLSDAQLARENKMKAKEMLNPTFDSQELVYRVQVAAYRKPQNYHWTNKETFGDVLEVLYPDGITRFTIGGTKYLQEAQELKARLVAAGITDAFIVAFKGKERVPLYQLHK
jgi:hypothetical protein